MPRSLSPIRSAILPTMIVAATVVGSANAQEITMTPDDKLKLAAFNEFMEGIADYLPTVNQISPDGLPVTFPYKAVGEQIVVDVDFGDGKKLPFMLDTGAPSYVTDEIADAHGGEVVVEMATIAGGGIIEWSPVKAYDSATIGGALAIERLTANVGWASDGPFYCITPNGLIGSQAMRNAVWQIHYGNEEITVAANVGQLDHVEDAIQIPFQIKEGGLSPTPLIELGVGNGKLSFIVDTGGGVPMTINTDAIATVGLELPEGAPASVGKSSGASGDFDTALTGLTVPIQLGDTELMVTAVVGDGLAPTTNGNMGDTFLRNFIVTFDWSTQTMYLEPLFEGDTVPAPNAAGAGINYDGETVTVSGVAVGGPADKAGLEVEEVVTKVDGMDVAGLSRDDFCDIQQAHPKTITTASGQTYDVSVIEGFFGGTGN